MCALTVQVAFPTQPIFLQLVTLQTIRLWSCSWSSCHHHCTQTPQFTLKQPANAQPNNTIIGTQNTNLSNHPIHDRNSGVALFYVPGTRLWIQSQREREKIFMVQPADKIISLTWQYISPFGTPCGSVQYRPEGYWRWKMWAPESSRSGPRNGGHSAKPLLLLSITFNIAQN